MGDVVNFADYREAPHCQGTFICMHCKSEWEGVVPMPVEPVECPECSLYRGLPKFEFSRGETHWRCNCGNMHFCITPDETYCPNCGTVQTF